MTDCKDISSFEPTAESKLPETARSGVWSKLKRGLLMTHTEMLGRLEAAVTGRTVLDEVALEILEEALIAADLGVETSLELVQRIRESADSAKLIDMQALRERLVDEISVQLLDVPPPARIPGTPVVTLCVGVNGVGKTTSAAKLAYLSQRQGEKVLLAAADTFRAGAVEQLAIWGQRLQVEVVKQVSGADPAAVVFDALRAAKARRVTHVIVDTAGRLHNKSHLMDELAKIKRIIDREVPDWQRETLLVLDATSGQNAVVQAREFSRIVEVSGILLAKIDGTAKGGIVVAIARDLRIPVVYLGVGESAEDLVSFRPREFAAALIG